MEQANRGAGCPCVDETDEKDCTCAFNGRPTNVFGTPVNATGELAGIPLQVERGKRESAARHIIRYGHADYLRAIVSH